MIVRHEIIDGWSVTDWATLIASRIASVSWPSISCTCQCDARNRSVWLSETARLVAPSIETELLSKNAISLPSFRCPANEIASWLMPSIRHPSPRKKYVK